MSADSKHGRMRRRRMRRRKIGRVPPGLLGYTPPTPEERAAQEAASYRRVLEGLKQALGFDPFKRWKSEQEESRKRDERETRALESIAESLRKIAK